MQVGNFIKNAKISTKFNVFLAVLLFISISLAGVALSTTLERRAEAEGTSKALILMQAMNSVRNYTQSRVNPLLVSRLETESTFTPEAIPTYSVREVFEYFRREPGYENFFFKDAAPNPTNLRDKADEFETRLVETFQAQSDLTETSGFRDLPGGKVFYYARPFVLTNQSCLQCHSSPEIAPKSLLNTYGAENGFGWTLNEIVAAQVLYVPAEEIFANARHSFRWVLGVLFGLFVVIFVLINLLLKRFIIQRIRKIAKVAQAVSTGDMDVEFEDKSNDEVGMLAKAFTRMKSSLEVAMRLLSPQKTK